MVRLELAPDRADRPSSPWLLSDELLEFLELRRLRQSWVRRSERVEDVSPDGKDHRSCDERQATGEEASAGMHLTKAPESKVKNR